MKENRKIVIQQIGKSFAEATAIVSGPLPEPGQGEVLIRNHFAGVNGVYDQMMCHDRIDHMNIVPPADTGVEAVGVIEKLGPGCKKLSVGMAVSTVKVGSGYCHYQVCGEADVVEIPAATADYLALLPSGVSALLALEKGGRMKTGEVVAITAAAGGLGNILVQLAVNAGNRVIAICGDDAKADWLQNAGAARVIQYRRESVADVIANEFKDSLDLVMESVGGELFDVLLENLAPFGRLVVCGFTSDRLPTEKVAQERIYTKLYWKAASVHGFMNYLYNDFADDARMRLLQQMAAGEIKPLLDVGQFIGLDKVADAVEHLLAGKNLGKVFVDLR